MLPGQLHKGLIIILDGLGDRPVPALEGQTPLEAAATPNMDHLASHGQWGNVTPAPEGFTPHTHSGVGFLFGLGIEEVNALARGPVELAGLGGSMGPGDVAFRSNFAQLEKRGKEFWVVDRRAGRIGPEAKELAAVLGEIDLGNGVRSVFKNTEQHRGILLLSGPGLSASVSATDPGDGAMPVQMPWCVPTAPGAEAEYTATLVNQLTDLVNQRLQDHSVNTEREKSGLPPANGIILRGAGTVLERHQAGSAAGVQSAVVTGCSTVRGLAKISGYEVAVDERFTGDRHTNLQAKVARVGELLASHDLVYLHIKAPDVFAHDRDPEGKRDFLEKVDKALSPLLEMDLLIAVCADHGTDSNTGWHVSDPVPGFVSRTHAQAHGKGVRFGEAACQDGPMGTVSGSDFLQKVLDGMRSS